MAHKVSRQMIQAYPLLVLSNEGLKGFIFPASGWCHVIKQGQLVYTMHWAPRNLWEREAYVGHVGSYAERKVLQQSQAPQP